jgi:hypothetical protein
MLDNIGFQLNSLIQGTNILSLIFDDVIFSSPWQLLDKHTIVDVLFKVDFFFMASHILLRLWWDINRIGGVMVSVLASNAVDRGFEQRSGQTKDYEIGICCFSAKYTALRRKSKDWLERNQDNVSKWGDMSIHRLLFLWASTIKIQLQKCKCVDLV